MLGSATLVLLPPLLAAMFLAVNMGGSGTAPSFAVAYGARLVRRKRIPLLFGIFVLLGALLAGGKVAKTLGKGLLPAEHMDGPTTTVIMVSVGLAMFAANLLRVPQSTSQATVFALVGPALFLGVLKTEKLFGEMIPAWFILPVISFVVAYGVGRIREKVAPSGTTPRVRGAARGGGVRVLVLLAGCYVAFAIGSNNVANAAGPVATMVGRHMGLAASPAVDGVILLVVTLTMVPCFAMGSALFGGPLVRRTGREIMAIGPFEAVAISLLTASLLLFASLSRGIPTSLVQLHAGAVVGMAMAREGVAPMVAHPSVRSLVVVWAVAPAVAGLLAYGLTGLLRLAGLL